MNAAASHAGKLIMRIGQSAEELAGLLTARARLVQLQLFLATTVT